MPIALAFTLGAWWLQQQARLPPLGAAWLLLASLAAALAWRRSRWPALRVAGRLAALAGWCAAGFFWAALSAQWKLADALPPADEGRDLRVVGVVEGLVDPTEHGHRFVLRVERVLDADAHVPRRVLLSWYERGEALPATAPVTSGERVALTVRLKRPVGAWNPHGFDRAAWLLEQGLRATGYVVDRAPVAHHGFARTSPGAWLDHLREGMRARLLSPVEGAPEAGVLAALALGDQRAIEADQWDLFTRTGVNHLMSISGLHITMLAALAHAVVLRLWRRSGRLALRWPAADVALGAGLATACAYALIAGFGVPAQRTVWMLAVVTGAQWLRLATGGGPALAAALLLVMVLDPMAVIAPGFWLSFGAVAALMAFVGRAEGRWAWFAEWTRAQWVLFVALAPLLIGLFQQVSLVAPIANAFAIPVVSFVVVPLALLGTCVPWDGPALLALAAMELVVRALEWLAALPVVQWVQAAPPAWSVVLAAAGAACLLLPRGFPSRWLGLALCLPMLLAEPVRPDPGAARLTLLDVGQGLAVVVETARETLLFDAGPAWGTDADAGGRIVVPFLRAAGVRRLSALVVSHDDRDHTGGVGSVLAQVPVDRVLTPLPPTHPLLAGRAIPERCVAGLQWEWSGVNFELLHPPAEGGATGDNATSCVLRVTAGGHGVLIPADIEAASERALLSSGVDLSADLLVVPHHGSKTSSTAAFLAAVRPRLALASLGYRNRFGHPHPDVAARYAAAGIPLLRSDRDGAIVADLGPRGVEVRTWRQARPRYWQSPP